MCNIKYSLKILLLFAIISLSFLGCKESPEKAKQKSLDLMTIKTLGLAYLEEFKLEDAEKEFLKFIKLAPKEKLGYANLGLAYLRMGRYPEAEKQLLKAIKIDAADPDIRLILATVYQMNDQREKAVTELKEALKFAPDNIKILYDLSELYTAASDEDSRKQRENYLLQLVEKAPGNLVPLLNLTEIYIVNGENDKALEKLEIIHKQFPEFPKEAIEYYDKASSLLKKQDKGNAIIQFTIFHNYLKVTSPYQAGIMGPDAPVAEQSAGNISVFTAPFKWCQQVNDDVVVVPGVESNIVSTCIDACPNHIPREIAIKRRHFDCNDTFNFHEGAPEIIRKDASADRRLHIKANDWHNGRNFLTVL